MRAKSLRRLAWEKSEGICILCSLWMPPPEENTYCGQLQYTVEHLLPKSRGGTNDIENLDGSHQFCNNFRGNTLLEDMPPGWKRVIKWKIKNLLANSKEPK